MADSAGALSDVREKIDSIDDQIHDLLMERTALVQSVIRAKAGSSAPPYRPGREAKILRRLVDRHRGNFPLVPLLLIWRQVIAASLGLQGGFTASVFTTGEDDAYRDVVGAHFGAATSVSQHQTVAGVVNSVSERKASVGILPFPTEGETNAWWPRLVHGGDAPKIIARLPFALTERQSVLSHDVLVIALQQAEPSDKDRSFIAMRTDAATSRGRITDSVKALSLEPRLMLAHEDVSDPEVSLFLIEVDGFVEADDERIAQLRDQASGPAPGAWLLGGYAVPFAPSDLRGLGARAS